MKKYKWFLAFAVVAFSMVGFQSTAMAAAQDEGLAPVGHGEAGIQPLCLAERARSFGVIEAEREDQSLVEEALSELYLGGERDLEVAGAFEQRRARRSDLHLRTPEPPDADRQR